MWVDLVIIIPCIYIIVSSAIQLEKIAKVRKENAAIQARLKEEKIKLNKDKIKLDKEREALGSDTGPGSFFIKLAAEESVNTNFFSEKQAEEFVKCQPINGPVGEIFMVQAEEDPMEKPVMHGLWRDDPRTPEGKYLVKRRDGSVVEFPNFTLGARDPCAPAALRAYADKAESLGLTQGYADSVRRLADEFDAYRLEHGEGDPDRGRHRMDDPQTIAEMRKGRSV